MKSADYYLLGNAFLPIAISVAEQTVVYRMIGLP
jgi:hypothetical protein